MPGEVKVENKPVDDFEAAFAQISEADAKGVEVAEGDIKPAVAVEKTAEQIEAERVAAEAAATAAAETAAQAAKTPEQIAAETEAAATAAAEAAKVEAAKGDDDLVKRLASVLKHANPDADAARAVEAKRVADEAAAAEAERVRQQEQVPRLSAEDLKKVQKFEADFPDVAEAQAIVRRAEYQQIVRHVFAEVTKANAERDAALAPFITLVQNLAERTHVGDLKTTVPDYDKLDVKKLAEWVGKQPDYLRPGYDMVMKQGSADQVKDLVSRYYVDSGIKPGGAPDPAAAAVAAAAAATAEATRKKAIAALAPVNSSRSAPAAQAPTDFDGAFAEFSKALVAQEATDRFTR